ncbi:hypothetical protein [Methanoculleus sp. UBA430]|uniref:hypothetical protein n=1 Tax=Methanoculleus sp. UBA430 TaxID=1915511 RepID=UPI00374369E8
MIVHQREEPGRGILRATIRQAGLAREEVMEGFGGLIQRPPPVPEVDPAVQRQNAYPVPTEGEYPGIVTDGPVLPERDLGERLLGFAESGEHLVLLLDRLPGAPITPGNLAEGKKGHLCREPGGPPDTMIPSGLEPTVRELPLRKGNRRGRIVPLHRGEQQQSFVGRRKKPQLSRRLHTPSRLALARHKEYRREVKVKKGIGICGGPIPPTTQVAGILSPLF